MYINSLHLGSPDGEIGSVMSLQIDPDASVPMPWLAFDQERLSIDSRKLDIDHTILIARDEPFNFSAMHSC